MADITRKLLEFSSETEKLRVAMPGRTGRALPGAAAWGDVIASPLSTIDGGPPVGDAGAALRKLWEINGPFENQWMSAYNSECWGSSQQSRKATRHLKRTRGSSLTTHPAYAKDGHLSSERELTREEYGHAYENGGYKGTIRFLRSQGANSTEAPEIAQAAWGRGLECLSQLRDKGSVGEWVNSIARNLMVSTKRRDQRLRSSTEKCEKGAVSKINLAAIDARRALQMCSHRQRQLLYSVYVEGHTCRDLAKQSGKSLGSVHSRVSRALRAVRNQMIRVKPAHPPLDAGTLDDRTKTEAITKRYGTGRKSG